MIESEFSALAKQCFARRIATQTDLEKDVRAIVQEQAKNAMKINWQFSIDKARKELHHHYQQINVENTQ